MNKSERLRKAREAIHSTAQPVGCLWANLFLLLLATGLAISRFWLFAAIPMCIVILWAISLLREKWLLSGFRAHGNRALLVTSDSVVWQERIEQTWLSRLSPGLVVLNRSSGGSPRGSLAWKVAERFVGFETEYCPAVLVLRSSGPARVFRFYRAFQEAKHGNSEPLEQMEASLFEYFDAAT